MKDQFTNKWIIDNAVNIVSEYEKGVLTLRALHYQLVGLGMTNDIQHYKRVVNAMIQARWDRIIEFDVFSDLDRGMVGETKAESTNVDDKISEAKYQIRAWMRSYVKNRWENQDYYPEVLIEKKALQGVFDSVCGRNRVALGACKGYPSLTFLHELYLRYKKMIDDEGKQPVIIYFGDYDPSGEDIPRSIQDNLERFGIQVEVRRIALMEHQVKAWNLPPAPAKSTDTRTAKWDGLGQVELDAVKPQILQQMCQDALDAIFDLDKFNELEQQEEEERTTFQADLKAYVQTL